jgi:hypothetical protein
MNNKKTKNIGTRLQVMRGSAKKTSGGLIKKDLTYNKRGKIISKKKSIQSGGGLSLKCSRLSENKCNSSYMLTRSGLQDCKYFYDFKQHSCRCGKKQDYRIECASLSNNFKNSEFFDKLNKQNVKTIIDFLKSLQDTYVIYYIEFFKNIIMYSNRFYLYDMTSEEFILFLITKHGDNRNRNSVSSSSSHGSSGEYEKINNSIGKKKMRSLISMDDLSLDQEGDYEKIIKELRMFTIEDNEFLVKYESWCLDFVEDNNRGNYCNLSIYMEHGTPLEEVLNASTMDQQKRKQILIEITKCIRHLHNTLGLVHFDLKPSNFIRISDTDKCKLIDFDTTLSIHDTYVPNNKTGSPQYINISLDGANKTLSSTTLKYHDIYSLGIIVWTIFFDIKDPWEETNTVQYNKNKTNKLKIQLGTKKSYIDENGKIKQGRQSNLPEDDTISKLIMNCIVSELNERPNIDTVLKRLESMFVSKKK